MIKELSTQEHPVARSFFYFLAHGVKPQNSKSVQKQSVMCASSLIKIKWLVLTSTELVYHDMRVNTGRELMI
jgi:hypothetical protein